MTRQLVDVNGIIDGLNTLNNADININRNFQTMQSQMSILNNWIGPAGDDAQELRDHLLALNEPRSNVLQNYVNILRTLVNPGYISAENTNTSLANQFR